MKKCVVKDMREKILGEVGFIKGLLGKGRLRESWSLADYALLIKKNH